MKTSLGSQASAGAAVTVLSLLCMALALRGPTFGHSEIDWDESAFALVSREILHNHWPFTTVFDDKSIVLCLHFAAAFALFGDNPAAFRLLGVIAVAAAAALVSFIAVWRLGFSRRWGLFLGACYILASTGFGGQAVYSEHFVNAYALLCALLLPDRRPIRVFFSGIAAGLAINCNYLAIFVIAGLIGGHLVGLRIASLRETRSLSRLIVCFLSGAAASTALVLLPIFLLSDPAAYFGPQLSFMSGYGAHRPAGQIVADFLLQGRELLPLAALAGSLMYWRRHAPGGSGKRASSAYYSSLFGGMGAGAVVAVLATGHVWVHYFLLGVPPSVLLVASLIDPRRRETRVFSAAGLLGACLMIAVPGLLFTATGVRDLLLEVRSGQVRADLPRRLARMARPRLHDGDTIYAVCAPLAVYQLLHRVPPTRYPMYPQNLNDQYASALGLNIDQEIASIFAVRPAVVVFGAYDRCDSISQNTWWKLRRTLRGNGYQAFASDEGITLFALPNGKQPISSATSSDAGGSPAPSAK